MDCIFCKIINGEIPSKKIYEDDKVIVFMDTNPNVDGHCLLVPKKHYTDYTELDDDIILHMNKVKKNIAEMLMKKLNVNAITFSMNYGDSQVVKHVHMHLLPNFIIKIKPEKSIDEIYDIIKPE
jgi:histidine triad (HIT) family protein